MKAIFETLVFIFTGLLLSQCEKEVTIPDDNFLNALIELGVDTNGDGIISSAEAELITFLDVGDTYISNLTGIEAFVNLDTLVCYDNLLTALDVSNNTALEFLSCPTNQLTSLDVSNNIALKYLWCGRNQLTSLDVSNNTALEVLNCDRNQLTTLDISNNTALGPGSFYGFPDLDISQMSTLYQVCVWELPFPPTGVSVDTTDSPNVYFTTDCSK